MQKARAERRQELEEAKNLKDEGCIDTPEAKSMRQDAVLRYKMLTEAHSAAKIAFEKGAAT